MFQTNRAMFLKLKKTWAVITLISMFQWAWGVPVSLLVPQMGGVEKAFAATIPGFIAGTTGIGTPTGAVSGSGDEAGTHSIQVIDSAVSSYRGNDAESNTNDGMIATSLAGTETLSFTLCGETHTTGALAATTANITTLGEVAVDIQTKINAAFDTCSVLVLPGGASPNKYFDITVKTNAMADATGSLNTITFNGGDGGDPTGLTGGTPTAGTDARAVDTFTPAAGVTTNGDWVAAHANPFTITHQPAPGTASTLVGLN